MKPGELERNLSRLVEVARSARERLAAIERGMTALRHDLETLAARSAGSQAHGSEDDRGHAATGSAGTGGSADSYGANRRDTVPRAEGDLSGREAGSE